MSPFCPSSFPADFVRPDICMTVVCFMNDSFMMKRSSCDLARGEGFSSSVESGTRKVGNTF